MRGSRVSVAGADRVSGRGVSNLRNPNAQFWPIEKKIEKHRKDRVKKMGLEGFEPSTLHLKGACSAN